MGIANALLEDEELQLMQEQHELRYGVTVGWNYDEYSDIDDYKEYIKNKIKNYDEKHSK